MGSRFNAGEYITNLFIEGLKRGKIPWQRPWKLSGPKDPTNYATKQPYHGINTLLLTYQAYSAGYKSNYWMGYQQAAAIGGQVRKGEKGSRCLIVHPQVDKETDELKYLFYTYRSVFNIDQMDGIDIETVQEIEFNPIAKAQQTLEDLHHVPEIILSMDKAAYVHGVNVDRILMPHKNSFSTEEDYYSTLFHEITHSTRHPSRLNRNCDTYAEEELVAEIGASILNLEAGIFGNQQEQSQAYINGWLSALDNDPNMILRAYGKAHKACEYLQDIKEEQIAM